MGNNGSFDSGLHHDSSISNDIDVKEPSMYRVIFFNDDYTTMDFVVSVLMSIFRKPIEEAMFLMNVVHEKGSAMVGIYTYDIAITKVEHTLDLASEKKFPLRCTVEEDK